MRKTTKHPQNSKPWVNDSETMTKHLQFVPISLAEFTKNVKDNTVIEEYCYTNKVIHKALVVKNLA